MSRDRKTSCTDYQGHADAAAVPFTSSFPVDASRDQLNESERPARPVPSFVVTTCASDTDEGDYETSSEGMIFSKRSIIGIHGAQAKESLCVYLKEKSASLSKRAAFNGNVSAIKREVIFHPSRELVENRLTQKTTYIRDSLTLISERLAQSKSLPILKNAIPSGVSADFTATDALALTSASSSACKRKMSMIIKRMTPLISPYPSTVSLMTGATVADFRGRRHETRRLASRTMLPILRDTTVSNDGRSEESAVEVTLRETRDNRRAINWDPQRDAIPTFVNDEGAANVTNDDDDYDDLVDVARNPYSSIKSVYFPPNLSDPLAPPYDLGKSKRHQRVSTDVETLLKIDHELGPLRYQYCEIIGKVRALSLSDTGFDLDIPCRLNRPDAFVDSALSPSASDYLPDRGQTYLQRATAGTGIANRFALVDKTSPSSTFSVVGKPTPKVSRISWLNENGSSRRQEALSYSIRDSTRALESLDGSRSSGRVGKSISYFPTTNSHTFQEENVLNDRFRNRCVSNSSFQSYRKSNAVIERATSAWDDWFARETVDTNPSNIFNTTEYNKHCYLNRTVKDSRTSTDDSLEIRRQKSSVSIVEVIDNNWSIVDERTANKRSNEHSEISSGNQSSMVVEREMANHGGNYHESVPDTVCVAKEISSSLALRSIDPGVVDPDHGILQTVSASVCTPQIRVVSVNTEFRTVEKRYTNRAVSPIQHSSLTTAPPTMASPSNILLAAKMSSVFVQQVRADSSREIAKIESPPKICSIDADKQDALASAVNKRDFCAQKVDCRSVAENLSRLAREFKRDKADLTTTTELRKTQYLRLPRAKEKITIIPIVLADGISEPSRSAGVDFAIPRYAVEKTAPKSGYPIASFDARKFRGMSLSSSRDNARYRRDIASPICLTDEFADEKRWRADGGTSVSHVNRHLYNAEEDLPYLPSTTTSIAGNPRRPIRMTTTNAGVVKRAREYRESGRQRIAKMIPGMRSTPEDFLCET